MAPIYLKGDRIFFRKKDNSRNLLTVNIGDFVSSKLWNTLEDAKSGDNILYFDNTVSI
jgi:hypothetical protein